MYSLFLKIDLILSIILLFCFVYNRYGARKLLPEDRSPAGKSRIPVLSHVLAFASGGSRLVDLLRRHSSSTAPVRFDLGNLSIFLISSPQDVRKVMYNLHTFSDHRLRARFIRNVLNVPRDASAVIEADNTGSKPLSLNPDIPHSRRIVYLQQTSTFDGLMMLPTIEAFIGHAISNLERLAVVSAIDERWTVQPDLFAFVRDLASTAIVNALCGPDLLQQCPDFINSFWSFDANIHWLHLGIPRFMRKPAYRARDSCQEAVKEWHRQAIEKSAGSVYPEELMWDEIWGMDIMRKRQTMYNQVPEFDAQARAGADLGLIWASLDNLVPSIYWLIDALLSSPVHLAACRPGIDAARLPHQMGETIPRFDIDKLASHDLLLSMLHEVLRVHVTSLLARTVEHDVVIGQTLLPQGSMALVVPWLQHRNREAWKTRDGAVEHPTSDFWAERFLRDDTAGQKFSTAGLGASFTPFGEGHHACPGRRFAIRAVLTIVATLVSVFEFEPLEADGWRHTKLKYDTFGYTPARPSQAKRFRVRTRGCKAVERSDLR